MTHKSFCIWISLATAAGLASIAASLVVVATWMTTEMAMLDVLKGAALAGACALLMMPGFTALLVAFRPVGKLRAWLIGGAIVSIGAGMAHHLLWPWGGIMWCIAGSVPLVFKIVRTRKARDAAAQGIAVIAAIVLPVVAITSWYVFDEAVPSFLTMLLDASGSSYGVPESEILGLKTRLNALMSLSGPLAFAVVGTIWNGGTLILISFHAKLSPEVSAGAKRRIESAHIHDVSFVIKQRLGAKGPSDDVDMLVEMFLEADRSNRPINKQHVIEYLRSRGRSLHKAEHLASALLE